MSNISLRIKEIVDKNNLSILAFEKKIESGNGVVGTIIKRNSNVSGSILSKILNAYPEISSEWLITGKGSMYKPEFKAYGLMQDISAPMNMLQEPMEEYKSLKSKEIADPNSKRIPLIPVEAIAGIEVANFSDLQVEDYYIVPDFPKADMLIQVRGDSMTPRYCAGDKVAIVKIDHSSFLQWGKVYVINTKSNGLIIKRINKSEFEKCISCTSDNRSYSPYDVPLEDILWFGLVLGLIGLE